MEKGLMVDDADDPHDVRGNIEKVVESFIAHELMKEVAAYLGRGRRYETTAVAEIEDRWVAAFKVWIEDTNRPSIEMDDLVSELSLRGLEPPMSRVTNEIAQMREMLIAMGPPKGGVFRDRISSFLKERDEPSA